MLTETARSAGCEFLAERFERAGYSVIFPRPPHGTRERGVMIVSRLATDPLRLPMGYLPHRVAAVTVHTSTGPLEVVGLYVPSRDATEVKVTRKRTFLEDLAAALPTGKTGYRLVLGDFNILEPTHVPRYRVFQAWEYGFYTGLAAAGYRDAFRVLAPDALEYSWVGRTGDGYRYDHAHASGPLLDRLRGCSYVHEPRTMTDRLTDHSALTVQLAVTAIAHLPVTDPTLAATPAATLF
ncbi:endonuclease/exonuclease/phosphatase [Streptomyces lichenis]|uniref:Endonuclease/exonuclease/phosphatase n=1 Tax=Streptomyces lichenis TaxID=2306967 RepID=A0ABT0I9I3_9ACTN|nr:endonuclease/exonuclease/phosphatase [Streptomyces lichenis]MCK8677982.1 endonuclease/exonuclease/phosphatase [Streptomyces lichenis]